MHAWPVHSHSSGSLRGYPLRGGGQHSPRSANKPASTEASVFSPRLGARGPETRACRASVSPVPLVEGGCSGTSTAGYRASSPAGAPSKQGCSAMSPRGNGPGNGFPTCSSKASPSMAAEDFLARNHVHQDVAEQFRQLPVETQLEVIDRGDVLHAGNSRAALMFRIKDVQEARGKEPEKKSPLVVLHPVSYDGQNRTWLSVSAPTLRKDGGKYYYEVSFGRGLDYPQVGWASDAMCASTGVGGDEHGWAADGKRHRFWHNGSSPVKWPESWRDGDTIGVAADLDKGKLVFIHNGRWFIPAPFEVPRGTSIFPAISAKGEFVFRFTRASFQHKPPDPSYMALMENDDAENTYGCRGCFARPFPRRRPFHVHESPRPVGRKLFWDSPAQKSIVDQVVFGRDMDYSGDAQFDDVYYDMFNDCYGMRTKASDMNTTGLSVRTGSRHLKHVPQRQSAVHELVFGHDTVGPDASKRGAMQFNKMYEGAHGKPSEQRPDRPLLRREGKRHMGPMEHAADHAHGRHHFPDKR